MTSIQAYLAVLLTIIATAYCQIVFKWQMNQVGELPHNIIMKITTLLSFLLNPWILSGLLAAFLATMSWMAALTKLSVSQVYPFTALNIILVTLFSILFFNESISINKIIGIIFIFMGLVIFGKS